MSANSTPGVSFEPPAHQIGPGVHEYNGPCVAFFSIAGIALQVPVILTHCGIVSQPNVPLVILSLTYVYICLSYAVTAISWTSTDISHWWSGRGWCDFDVRMFLAASLGVLATQCVINWNMLDILRQNSRIVPRRQTWSRTVCEVVACLFLPVVNLAVSTFTMEDRFDVVQDIGCLANVDLSVAYIMTYLIWLPILGLGAIVTIVCIALHFWLRGKSASIESISFVPHMGFAQFVRIIIFSLVVSVILGPLSISLSVINFINLGKMGVHKLAWIHGKPADWNSSSYLLLKQVPIPAYSWGPRPTFILNFITRYINIVIAWLLFLCYGTGSVAQESYVLLYRKITGEREKRSEKGDIAALDLFHFGERSPTGTVYDSATSSKFNEWDAGTISGNKAFHLWEEVMADSPGTDTQAEHPRSHESRGAHIPHMLPVRRPPGPIGNMLGGIQKSFLKPAPIPETRSSVDDTK